CMEPLAMPRLLTNSSVVWLSTSTSALPIATTSSPGPRSPTGLASPSRGTAAPGQMPVDQEGEPLPRARRDVRGIRDERLGERLRAAALAARARRHPPQGAARQV